MGGIPELPPPRRRNLDGQPIECENCSKNCATCNNNKNCLTCKPGYIFFEAREEERRVLATGGFIYGECYPCPMNCKTCISAFVCETCADGFYFDAYKR